MRSKAPLAMMEQMVMLLVFALAAALCLQAFVKSDEMSGRSEARDRAAALCQTAAEAIRATGGNYWAAAELMDVSPDYPGLEKESVTLYYDEEWALSETLDGAYCLWMEPLDSGIAGLGKARISVTKADSFDALFEIEVAWQEVSAHG